MHFVHLEHNRGLSYSSLGDIAAQPVVFFLHGIMGSKKNLWSFVSRFHHACPAYAVVNVDLRNHGESSKHWPPYTVEACAFDIAQLCRSLAIEPRALVGHSFGGKVALCAAPLLPSLRQVWMLDCSPRPVLVRKPLDKPASLSALEIIAILSEMSWPVASRKELVSSLIARGVSNSIALWMTTNLYAVDGGLSLVFDPAEINAMLHDFIALDGWPMVESLNPNLTLHLVAAEHGGRVSSEDERRLAVRTSLGQGYFHRLDNAGHFLHADNPQGLLEIMEPFF